MNHLPTIKSLLSTGWIIIKKNWKFIISAAIVTVLIMILLQIIQDATNRNFIASIFMMIVSIIVSIALSLGWAKVLLNFIRNGSAQWNDFKTNIRNWKGYIVAQVIYTVFKVLSLIFFIPLIAVLILSGFGANPINLFSNNWYIVIIPLIIGIVLMVWLAIRYVFIVYIASDHPTLSGWKILKKSAKMTKGNMWKILWYSIVFGFVNLLGLICLVIGLLVTVPITKLAMAKLYDSLKEKST